ncbi:MAG: histidinol-phosphate transaminase [Anaerolineae bacterium]|nr:histidinol-phosphate transaminase [Anaerolineae bacterium]
MDIESLIAPNIREMKPYVPGTSVVAMAQKLGCAVSDLVKLDANENPYGPPPAALQALANNTAFNYYPDPDQNALREAIGKYVGVPIGHIVCGAGGDEILDLIARMFLCPGDAIIDFPPTFGMYAAAAQVQNVHYISIPRRADFSVNVDAVEALITNYKLRITNEKDGQALIPKPKLLFIANPNNPDGSVVSEADLLRLLALPVVVVLDEAYIQFSTQPSRADWVLKYDNLIVVHTLSKLIGLAGLRVGYGVFPLTVAAHLWRMKQVFTPSLPGHLMAIGALSDPATLDEMGRKIVAERNRFCESLSELGWIEPYHSEASFVLCKINKAFVGPDGQPDPRPRGLVVQQALEAQGILIRFFNRDPLRDCVRISIGQPAQMDRVLAALRML